MARARSPNRDKAFELWKESNGQMLLKDIAEQLGVSDSQIRKWKNQDKWEQKINGNVTKVKSNVTKKTKKQEKEPVVLSDNLTDKQRLFCIYYIKYFNATKAYQKAYGCDYSTANKNAYTLMVNQGVRAEIDRLKQERFNGVLIDAQAVLQKYIDIAFADITDFVTFGKKEEQVIGLYGPMFDNHGNPVMQEVNYVDFKESSEIDGTIVTEAKQGKEGISIKLADKMKALEFLAKYTDLLSEADKKRLQNEKLKAETAKVKAETERMAKESKDEEQEEIIIVDEWTDEDE